MTAPDPDKMEERLDELQERIEGARRQAEEHGTIDDTTPEQTFIDPDADGRTDDADEDPGTIIAT
jgi:hypothetical protein